MSSRALIDNDAFNLLLSLEEAVLLNGGEFVRNADSREQWSGVKCVVAGTSFILPLDQVAEILEPRFITAIPGCASWVKGLMNVRGRLLPVFGLSEFLNGGRNRNTFWQIILVEQGATFCGIAVDKVFGMQKFLQEDFREPGPLPRTQLEGIDEYVDFFTMIDGDSWYRLDIGALAVRMSQANPAATVSGENRTETSRPHPDAVLESIETTPATQ